MAVKVGNSWVSEAALAYAKEKANADTDSILEDLSKQYPEVNFSTNTAPFSQSGVKNIQISPNILTEMKNDPEKRLEYEALIYDCATGIDMLNQSGGGFHTKAAGFIINPDGSLGGWGISVSDDDGTKAKSKVSLDKNKKETWAEKIRKKQKEKIAEAKKEAKLRAQKESRETAANNDTDSGNFENESDYYSYLQKNYDSMSKGNVTISSQYLKQCAGDSTKAKELEDFLKQIPDLEKQGYEDLSARNKAQGGTVTYYQQTWMVNKDGSIQSTVYSVTETGMTNAERMKKNMDERLEQQKEKKEEEEEVKERKEAKEEQEERLSHDMDKDLQTNQHKSQITVKYVEAKSEIEAKAMQQKDKLEDAYYQRFDVEV